jgi:hypothetical protein
MDLTADQDAKFRDLCKEIKPGEHGCVMVEFVGTPSNIVRISGEKNYRFHGEKAEATCGEALDRRKSGRVG